MTHYMCKRPTSHNALRGVDKFLVLLLPPCGFACAEWVWLLPKQFSLPLEQGSWERAGRRAKGFWELPHLPLCEQSCSLHLLVTFRRCSFRRGAASCSPKELHRR